MFTSALKMFLNSSVVTAVTDAYFNLVTLLLPGNGTNGAQNNTFLDSSTNNFTITRNGNTTQGTFTPFSQTGWGNFFDGTGDYLSNTSTALITNTVSTFTVECWIYLTATPPADVNNISALCTLDGQPTGPTNYLSFGPKNDGKLYLFWFDGAVKSAAGGTALALNTWYHIACVVNSNAIQFYVNGVAETMSGTTTLTNRSGSQGNFAVGSSSAGQITGYISNFRVTTTAVYTSAFTPPTSALTNITNTKLLTCQSNRFVDNSSNAYALTINGTPSVQAFSPFAPTAAYSTTDVGGSGYFDGTGDYLSVADNANLRLGTSAFTIQAWIYRAASGTAHSIIAKGGASTGFVFQVTSGNVLRFTHGTTNVDTTTTIPASSWTHVAAVRTGTGTNEFQLYINGVSSVTATVATNFNQTDTLYVGADRSAATTMNGYISGLKYTNGTAESISVPTSPPTATTNVALLTNYTNAGITDATAKNDLETVGNAQISTTQSKFGGSSMYFDGTGDLLFSPASQNYSFPGDFTIECWVNTSTISTEGGSYRRIFATGPDAVTSLQIVFSDSLTTSGNISLVTNTFVISGNINAATGAWVHVALARAGSSLRLFVDGVQSGSTLTTTQAFTGGATNGLFIGSASGGTGRYLGYIDDFRITTGYARYTSNFTPPTAAFALQ